MPTSLSSSKPRRGHSLETEREARASGRFFTGRRAAEREDHVGSEASLEADCDCGLVAIKAGARRETIVLVGDRRSAAYHYRHRAAHRADAVDVVVGKREAGVHVTAKGIRVGIGRLHAPVHRPPHLVQVDGIGALRAGCDVGDLTLAIRGR
jgi:hypothetical protein